MSNNLQIKVTTAYNLNHMLIITVQIHVALLRSLRPSFHLIDVGTEALTGQGIYPGQSAGYCSRLELEF